MRRSIIYFTRVLPGLHPELTQTGYEVRECLAISEVFEICSRVAVEIVVIDASVEDEAATEIARHYATVRLRAGSTVADVLWLLAQLSPSGVMQ